ncbi:HAD-IG family 5'-nucleotidase [bacterium]|nr:HAD-IG family 5'-nucleotidase [bacterium]
MTPDDQAAARPALESSRRIFVNRNLRMASIAAIGFDMDHTLAVYRTEPFNKLTFDMAIESLIRDADYPSAIREVVWDPDGAIRGLCVDKKQGNVLKIDGYNHISRARHGLEFLEKDEKKAQYPRARIRIGKDRYRIFDTLFDMPEGILYAGLVDLKDREEGLLPVSYRQLYDDIRGAVDTMHADGSLKARITADLGAYFERDPDLVPTLRKFRQAGKKLFLLTNSEVEYTGAVMDFLVGGPRGSWEDLFDLVVCFARKPGFFVARGDGEPVPAGVHATMPNRSGRCFVGGDSFFLEREIGAAADEIIYFGDHTYGDILRSKKSVGWRTAMIVPEVADEVAALGPLRDQWRQLAVVETRLEDLVTAQDELREAGVAAPGVAERLAALEASVREALGQRARLQRSLRAVQNPIWESLFREGRAASRLGRQIMEFACIYTGRVSNFLHYPADKFFARPVEILPHERWARPEA